MLKSALYNIVKKNRELFLANKKEVPFYYDRKKNILIFKGLKFEGGHVFYIPVYVYKNVTFNSPQYLCVTSDFEVLKKDNDFFTVIDLIKQKYKYLVFNSIKFENTLPLINSLSDGKKQKYFQLVNRKMKTFNWQKLVENGNI
jgi:hypothetical protein